MVANSSQEVPSSESQQISIEETPQPQDKEVVETSSTINGSSDGVDEGKRPVDPSALEKQPLEAANDSSDDENVVDWDGDDDPKNPFNWPTWRKVLNCFLVSALSFMTPLGSCKSLVL